MREQTLKFNTEDGPITVLYTREAEIIDGAPVIKERFYGFYGDDVDWTWSVGTREDMLAKINRHGPLQNF